MFYDSNPLHRIIGETKMAEKREKKATILVIDDTPDILEMLAGLFKDTYRIKLANNPHRALKYLEEDHLVDLILLDVLMPEMDGFEVCRLIKANPQYAHIPVIFITVLEEESDIVKGFEVGAVDYVTKPFEPKVLKARVKTHVELKQIRDEMAKNIEEKEVLLLKQSKMAVLGEMFENITHQWKQPLSIISLHCANMQMEYDLGEFNPDNLIPSLNAIEESVKHLTQTINDFRFFMHDSVQKEHFDLRQAVQQTLSLVSSKLNNRSIGIQNSLPQMNFFTYKNELIHVIMNLINNSIDALENIDSKRWISIEMEEIENGEVLRICDNGGGISEAILPIVFDKYVTTKSEVEGTGLGLYMSREIITKRIGGEITAINTDDGACFCIRFPKEAIG